MRKILIQLGFIKPTALDFNLRKNNALSIFTETLSEMQSLIAEQRVYISNLLDQQAKINKEIDLTYDSITESESTIEKIENILK